MLLNFMDNVGTIDFDTVLNILSYGLATFWIILIGWVWIDSGERTSNIPFRIFSTLLVLILNLFGYIVYLIIRPRQTIEEIYWSDLERRYLKYETSELGDCQKCGFQMQPGFVNCPQCGFDQKIKCKCDVHIDKDWKYCPFCGEQHLEKMKVDENVDAEVMEEQVKATKSEAFKKVESKQTKYARKKGVVVSLRQLFSKRKKKKIVVGAVISEKLDKKTANSANKKSKKNTAQKNSVKKSKPKSKTIKKAGKKKK